MSDIQSLIKRAEKYLKSSKMLIKENDYESAVSRTYYAMFYSVEAILLTKDITSSSHKGIISQFGKHFIKTDIFSQEMSKNLSRAFEKRQLGDYGFDFVISEKEDLVEAKII